MTSTPTAYRRGAGIVLLNADNLVFVAQRIDTPGAWQLPQGGIDKGESPWEAAKRELYEETNISSIDLLAETPDWLRYDLPDELIGKVWRGRYRGQEQRWYCCRFTGDESEIDLTAHTPEFDAWRWVGPDDVIDAIVPFKRDLYGQVFSAFRNWLAAG